MDYSQDELVSPEWLNHSFLEKVLKSTEGNENAKLIDFKTEPAVTKGNHFASIMFRANVKYRTNDGRIENESFIIKAMPEQDGVKKDMLEGSNAFDTELRVYLTLCHFENEFKKLGIDIVFGAKLIYYVEPTVIVLQDLKACGYSLFEKGFLNFDDYKFTLGKLAKWHAASFKINLEGKSDMVQYFENRSFVQDLNFRNNVIFTKGLVLIEELFSEYAELNKYLDNFKNIKNILLSESSRSNSSTNSKINVLNHGDFHLKNILFKEDGRGKFADVLFVDFQFSVWGSPAIDLIYSMYMMLNPEIRHYKRDEVIHYYYTCFVDELRKLKFNGEIPTFEDLQIEVLKMKKFEIFILTTITPYVYQMASGVKFDGEEVFHNEQMKRSIYRNPEYIKDLKRMLPWYYYQGYFYNNNNNQSDVNVDSTN